MTIYLLWDTQFGDSLIGVFSSAEKAEAYKARFWERLRPQLEITTEELDHEYPVGASGPIPVRKGM